MRAAVCRAMPVRRHVLVPNQPTIRVAIGDTSMAWEMERPPTKAKSRYVAPGKTSLAR